MVPIKQYQKLHQKKGLQLGPTDLFTATKWLRRQQTNGEAVWPDWMIFGISWQQILLRK